MRPIDELPYRCSINLPERHLPDQALPHRHGIALPSLQVFCGRQPGLKGVSIMYKVTTILLLAIFGLAACGQKGPLFLPGDPSQIRPQPPAADEPSDEDDDEESGRESGPRSNP